MAYQKGIGLELKIAELFKKNGYIVTHNVKMQGKSGAEHQIDVYAEYKAPLHTTTLIVEAKSYQSNIDKEIVMKLIQIQQDLSVDRAILVTTSEFTPGTIQTASQARTAYNDAVKAAHGNAAAIGQAMTIRDQAIATAQTTKTNAVVTADVTHDKAINDAWTAHETTVYAALATRDGNDGTAQSTFYTTIGNATLATRSQTIGQAHVTEDNSILQARETRITAVETADVTKDQAIGSAHTAYITAESSARVTLDNSYTTNGKTWNAELQSYWNAVAPLEQTRDSAIAKANADQVAAVGSADGARDQTIDQAHATMYGSISAAYS